MTTRFADVWDRLDRLRTLVADGAHREMMPAARRVT